MIKPIWNGESKTSDWRYTSVWGTKVHAKTHFRLVSKACKIPCRWTLLPTKRHYVYSGHYILRINLEKNRAYWNTLKLGIDFTITKEHVKVFVPRSMLGRFQCLLFFWPWFFSEMATNHSNIMNKYFFAITYWFCYNLYSSHYHLHGHCITTIPTGSQSPLFPEY